MGKATHVELEPVGFWFTTPFGRNFPKDDGDLNQYQTGVESFCMVSQSFWTRSSASSKFSHCDSNEHTYIFKTY